MGRALSFIENSLVFSITTQIVLVSAVVMMLSSLINCLMRLWSRFIKNLYKDESYLTHTLPVKKKTIFASKVMSALICIFTTIVVILVCLFICFYSETNIQIIKDILELTASTYNITVLKLLLLIAVVLYFEIIFTVLIGYVGIIIGYKFNKNKMVKTIIISFLLYILTQALTLVIIYFTGVFNPDIMNLINTKEIINVDVIKYIMYGGVGIYFVYIIFYYILGKKQFEKGINID